MCSRPPELIVNRGEFAARLSALQASYICSMDYGNVLLLLDREQFDLKYERGVGADGAAWGAWAVG